MAGGAVSELRARFSAQISNFRSAISSMRSELSGIGDDARDAVSDANRAFDNLDSTMNNVGDGFDLDNVESEIQATTTEIEEFGNTAEQSTGQAEKSFGKLSGTLLKIGGAVGGLAAVTGAIGGAITVTEDYQRALNGVEAQTGATGEETAELGEYMKNIYANNYGESFQEIGDTLAQARNITGAFGEDLQYLAQDSLMLRDTFGYEMTESLRSADKLMKQFGLTGGDAMGIIATGSQLGLDYAQDLLPTIDEYSVYFKQAGYDAEGMFGVFQNAKNAGVFNLDYAADGIKEFGIIMTENSDRANEALRSIGLTNDKELRAKFAEGGESAREAMQTIAKALNDVKDPQLQTIAGVELFGTKFEDMGATAVMEMLKVNDSIQANTDTLQKIDEVKYNTVGEALKGIGRALQVEVIEPIQTKVMPTINGFINNVRQNLPAIKTAFSEAFNAITGTVMKFAPTFESLFTVFKNVGGWLASTLVVAFTALGSALAPIINTVTSLVAKFTEWSGFIPILNGIIAGILTYKAYMLALKAPMLITTALTKGWMIAQRLLNIAMAMNPIGLLVAALVGLGVALYTAYQKSETFRNIVNGAFTAVKNAVMFVFNWLITNIPIWIENIKGWFTNLATGISNIWSNIKAVVIPLVVSFAQAIIQKAQEIASKVMNFISPLIEFFKKTWNNIKLLVLSIVGVFLNLLTGNFEGLKTSLIGIITAFQRQFINIITTVKNMGVNIFTALKNLAVNIFNGLKSAVVNTVTGLKNGVVNTVNALKNGFVNAVNSVKSSAVSGFNGAKTAASNAISGMKTAVSNGISKVKGFFTDMKSNIVSTVKGIDLFQIGKNIVQGLINGIGGMISSVKNKASELANSITSKITGLLKIKSPSRLMREYGGFVGEGLAIGIDKSQKLVNKASQALAESAAIEPDPDGIGALAGETIAGSMPQESGNDTSSGGGLTTNYQAPLMQVDNLYVNDRDDAREVSNGLFRLQQDHDRARGRKTT